MIITRTPFRVSLFGGGADFPAWYRANGGRVIGFAIDKYCYITIRRLPPFFPHKHRIVYSLMENVVSISEIKHPAVRAVFGEMGVSEGIELHHDGDLPARSGLGSSSAFTVGLLQALYALESRMVAARQLADEAIRIEQDVIKENVGSQDQIWAAFGGLSQIDFQRTGSYQVTPLMMNIQRRKALMEHCQLYFTGLSRFSSDITADSIANLGDKSQTIRRMMEMVDEAAVILGSPDGALETIGAMLHEAWMLKRGMSDRVSNSEIDTIYKEARSEGAIGGKILGAGGGGFMLLFVPPDRHQAVRTRLSRLVQVPIDIADDGARVVVYEPDGLERVYKR